MEVLNYEFESTFNKKYSMLARKIFNKLSENSRVSISDLAKEFGVSRHTVIVKLKSLEKELGIAYTLEFNEDKLGLINPHLVLVKFDKKPDYSEIKALLSRFKIPQFAAVVRGSYDMVIYANAVSRDDYVHWDKGMQTLLAKYGLHWQSSEVAHRQLGFFPIRNDLLEELNLPEKYKQILLLLNSNSRISFSDLSRKLGVHINTIAYTFKKMQEMNYIKRFTAIATSSMPMAISTIFGKYTISSSFEEDAVKERKALMSDDEYPIISRYAFVSQLIGSYDWFSIGIFDNEQIAKKQHLRYYKKVMANDKVEVKFGIVERVLLGYLPLRSIDTKANYDVIKWVLE
ncbi:MAG: winged helix-turn-helix transcriptional regulator [Candidatus Micrarchaeia archaeon]